MLLVVFERVKTACSVQASVAFDSYAGEQGSDLFEMYIFCCMYCVCFDAKTSRERRRNGNVQRCAMSRSTCDGEVTSWPIYICANMIGPRVSVWLDNQRDGQNKRRGR